MELSSLLSGRDIFQFKEGLLSQGALIALINYLLQILVELVKLAMLINSLNQSYISAKRIEGFCWSSRRHPFKIRTKASYQWSGFTSPRIDLYLSWCGPAFSERHFLWYDSRTNPWYHWGTGSGKSSLVQLILGLYPADKGSIDLYRDGSSPRNLEQWRYWIAYVPQKSNSLRGTIRSNLTLGLIKSIDQELWQALEIAQTKDFVSEKEGLLDALVEAGGRNFSGGQKQRLSIAWTVLRQTPFLILDDATSALDTITESKLLKAIRENRQIQV